TEFKDLDDYLKTTMLQAFTRVKGVPSARAFHSIHGQIVFVVDLEQTGSLDAVFEAPEMGKACLGLSKWLVRTSGAEIMWEIGTGERSIAFALTFN
ncbi:unnamed protein product, partial [marine sediment metagenome]